jgi:hypothetical protein
MLARRNCVEPDAGFGVALHAAQILPMKDILAQNPPS